MTRALVALVLVVLAACGGAPDNPEAQRERELAEARSKARGTLSFYWEHFKEPGEGEYDFSLKAAFPRRDGQPGVEEAWVERVARAPDKIIGELSVRPRYLGPLDEGAIMEFQEHQVVDWAFFQGEKLLGHYTTRVLLPQMDSMQQEWMRSVLSENPTGETE